MLPLLVKSMLVADMVLLMVRGDVGAVKVVVDACSVVVAQRIGELIEGVALNLSKGIILPVGDNKSYGDK